MAFQKRKYQWRQFLMTPSIDRASHRLAQAQALRTTELPTHWDGYSDPAVLSGSAAAPIGCGPAKGIADVRKGSGGWSRSAPSTKLWHPFPDRSGVGSATTQEDQEPLLRQQRAALLPHDVTTSAA
jgi:hypothetical protein